MYKKNTNKQKPQAKLGQCGTVLRLLIAIPHKRATLLVSIFLALCVEFLMIPAVHASHPDDGCPDIEINGGESMQGWVHDRDSGALLPSGSIVPPSTFVTIYKRATAFGSCHPIYLIGDECYDSQTIYQRTVSHADYFYTSDYLDPDFTDFENQWRPSYGRDPNDGTTALYHVLDTHDEATSTGPRQEYLPWEGIFIFEFVSRINSTVCLLLPEALTGNTVIITVDEDTNDLGCPDDASVGNPCNVATGNKFESKIDLPLTHGGLSFRRAYNSKFDGDLGLGVGWSSTYQRRIQIINNLITIRRPGGYAETFSFNGSSWDSEAESHNALTEDGSDYVLQLTDDSVERYNSSGQLLQITQVDGRVQTAAYDVDGQLQTITADNGESLNFVHNINGHLESMTHQPSNRSWIYSYNSGVIKKLTGVQNPDGTTLQYHYENIDYPYLLTGITNEQNIRYATFGYNNDGLVEASNHAGNVNRVDIIYNDATTRTLTNSHSDATTYTINPSNGVSLIADISGPGCSTCSKGNSSFSYDPTNNNRLSKTENGQITRWGDYNSGGNPGYMIEADATPQARRTDYIYDPRFNGKASFIIEPSVYDHPASSLPLVVMPTANAHWLGLSVTGLQATPMTITPN